MRLESGSQPVIPAFRLAIGRPPAVGASAMVSASNPFAVRAGLRMLERGGNAVDAALAAIAVLGVTEPMNVGVGGDAFALIADGDSVAGLDAAGPAPAHAGTLAPVERRGPRSVTVPGAVAGWAALSERFGRLGLDSCLVDAIDGAEQGLPLCARAAALWGREQRCPSELGPPSPRIGQRVALPELGATLRRIALEGPAAIYSGPIARAIAEVSWVDEEDLAAFHPQWVSPLRATYRGREVLELPPPTQGVVVLEALRLLEADQPTLPNMIHAVALALDDGAAHVRDDAEVDWLLDPIYIDVRRGQPPRPVSPIEAGTSHVCVVDSDRLTVSLIASVFGSFGSGVVAPNTGIVLHNRGACFSLEGQVRPGKRPYHTIIPAMITSAGDVIAAFGVVGGHLQAQAHVQLVSALVDDGFDPQAALDRSRFRIEGSTVLVEEGLSSTVSELRARGYRPVVSRDWSMFGCGSMMGCCSGAPIRGWTATRLGCDGRSGGHNREAVSRRVAPIRSLAQVPGAGCRSRSQRMTRLSHLCHKAAARRCVRRRDQISHAVDGSKYLLVAATVRNVTELGHAADALVYQATHDALTGLPNRALFMDRLGHALARARRSEGTLAVMFLDLDHFKLVNDTSGHETGDMVLVALTPRLRGALRPSDTIARFGGDEFVVLCEDLPSDQDAVQIARRIVDACSQPLQIGGYEYIVSVSAGVVIVDDAASAVPSDLLRDADAAMYRAKAIGRGRVEVFDEQMQARLIERTTIESGLRQALERAQLRVHYQPVISLTRNEIVGAEALLRWQHPLRGLLEPTAFLTVAESSGLIVPIGAWLIEQACHQAARWRDARPLQPIQVLVNVSRRQLARADLASLIAELLRSTSLAPDLFGLEIKESTLLGDERTGARALRELRAVGVRLLLDDFGGGFSSLSHLRRFRVDALKLERRFVDGLGRDPVDGAVLGAVLSIAGALGVGVTAKGVETPEQLSRLRGHGCPSAQGYLFARPGPAAAFDALLDAGLPAALASAAREPLPGD